MDTEVKVLESPSVLKPIYDFVKEDKAKKGKNITEWSFLKWRDNNLKIELLKNTSVLNIHYRDTDPNIVLPVIEQISDAYQKYSAEIVPIP